MRNLARRESGEPQTGARRPPRGEGRPRGPNGYRRVSALGSRPGVGTLTFPSNVRRCLAEVYVQRRGSFGLPITWTIFAKRAVRTGLAFILVGIVRAARTLLAASPGKRTGERSTNVEAAAVLPGGTDFLFDIGVELVEKQMERIDRLDSKVGTLWGFLGAVIIWVLGAVAPEKLPTMHGASLCVFTAGLALFVGGFLLALVAILPQPYSFPVNYREMVDRGERDATAIKYEFVEGVLRAYSENFSVINRKARLLQGALCFSAAGVVVAGAGLLVARLLAR